MQQSQNPRCWLSSALVVVALLGASCGGDDAGEAVGTDIGTDQTSTTVPETTTTTAPPATTTTTAAPTPEEEVLAAYAAYWNAVDEAFAPPQVRPESPALRQYATGQLLPEILKSAEDAVAENVVARIPEGALYSHRAEVVSIDEDTATVRDCNINDEVIEVAGTGETVDDGVSTRLYIGMLVREGGQWKVAVLDRVEGWEGVAGCALE